MRSTAMPLGTTRSRAPGCQRRRSARATAPLTAIVRSAVSPTARISSAEVSGIVRRVTTNAGGSLPRQRSHVSARRSSVAWEFTTSTRSRATRSASDRAASLSGANCSGSTARPASCASRASSTPPRHPTSRRWPRRASSWLKSKIDCVEPAGPPWWVSWRIVRGASRIGRNGSYVSPFGKDHGAPREPVP